MGEADPNGAQRLLYAARWDADAVRDELQRLIMEHRGDPAGGVLILDGTGFLKKGRHSVGVARQYSGTAGKVENCQVSVFLAYATEDGAALLDRRLYLPEGWASDAGCRAAAKIPAAVTFQTKPRLGRAMLTHAFATGVAAGWVLGVSVYGCDRTLRLWLGRRRQPSALEVRRSEQVWVLDGVRRQRRTVTAAAAALPAAGWRRLSAGDGAKGPREYDRAWMPVAGLRQDDWRHWLLMQRGVNYPSDLAYYFVAGPAATTLEQVVRVAELRWRIEGCFEEAKGEAGLDEYEVRHWHSWHRHITFAMLAHAFLVLSRRTANAAEAGSAEGGAGAALGGRDAPAVGPHAANAATRGAVGLVTLAAQAPATAITVDAASRCHRDRRVPLSEAVVGSDRGKMLRLNKVG